VRGTKLLGRKYEGNQSCWDSSPWATITDTLVSRAPLHVFLENSWGHTRPPRKKEKLLGAIARGVSEDDAGGDTFYNYLIKNILYSKDVFLIINYFKVAMSN